MFAMSTPPVISPSDSPSGFIADRYLRLSNASDSPRRKQQLAAAKKGVGSFAHIRHDSAPELSWDPVTRARVHKALLGDMNKPKTPRKSQSNSGQPKRPCDIRAQQWEPPPKYEQSDTMVRGNESDDDDVPFLEPAKDANANRKEMQDVPLSPPPAIRANQAVNSGQGGEPASPALSYSDFEVPDAGATESVPLRTATNLGKNYGTTPSSQKTEKWAWYIKCMAWFRGCSF